MLTPGGALLAVCQLTTKTYCAGGQEATSVVSHAVRVCVHDILATCSERALPTEHSRQVQSKQNKSVQKSQDHRKG